MTSTPLPEQGENPIKSEDELRIGKKTLVLDGVNPIRFRFDGDHLLYQFDEDGNIFCVEPVDHIRQPAKKVTTNQEEGEK